MCRWHTKRNEFKIQIETWSLNVRFIFALQKHTPQYELKNFEFEFRKSRKRILYALNEH